MKKLLLVGVAGTGISLDVVAVARAAALVINTFVGVVREQDRVKNGAFDKLVFHKAIPGGCSCSMHYCIANFSIGSIVKAATAITVNQFT